MRRSRLAILFRKRLATVRDEKRTAGEDERKFEKHLSHWERRQASGIKKADVQSLIEAIAKDIGKTSANRVLSLIKATFEYGIGRHITDNPAKSLRKYSENQRERYLSSDELPRFLKAIELEPPDYRDIFALLLFTGARKMNVCSMEWREIDMGHRIWRIPASKYKTKKSITIPLAGPVIEILERRKEQYGDCRFVFPAPYNSTGHITELRRPWTRVCKNAQLEDFRIHDLRHSLASWQAMNGASLLVIGQSLGHADAKSTARYSHLQTDVVRKSVDDTVSTMLSTKETR